MRLTRTVLLLVLLVVPLGMVLLSQRETAIGEPADLHAAITTASDGITHYVRFRHGDRVSYGILEGESIRELSGDLFDHRPTGRTLRRADVQLLAPIDPMRVQKAMGVAVNFRRANGPAEIPHPRFFAKFPTSLNDPDGRVEVYPEAGNLNYEGELVLIIGKQGRHIPVERAGEHIFGVTIGNDYSENTWYGERQGIEEPTRLISKAADTWGVIGPSIARGLDYSDLRVVTRLNGEVVNQGRTSDMVNGPARLVSYISRYVTLMPGDVIFTGTYYPVEGARRVMRAGDVVEVEIEGLGVQRSTIVAVNTEPR